MNILVLNAGSSSLKFQIIATDLDRIRQNKDVRLLRGEVERIGAEAVVTMQKGDDAKQTLTASLKDISGALDFIIRWAASRESGVSEIHSISDIHAVGHRVVHGGELFTDSVLITDEVIRGIENCIDLAPLHNPTNLQGIRAMRELLGPRIPQVAVFDTAFHHSLTERAYLYAIPYHFYLRYRIRRYGFHGISHRYMEYRYRTIRNVAREQTNLVSLHLGNGCSAAAIRGGRSVDTSMGMTPLEGLVMGTRSGDVDPAILGYIAAKEGLSIHEVETILNKQSGLLGISGLTHDMRVLQNEAQTHADRRANLAIDIFCYRIRKYIGAFLAAMGGADAIVFTGGIGENSPGVRANVCEGLEWAGLSLDGEKNQKTIGREGGISREDSRLAAYVIPTDEELLIARDTARCILVEANPQ
ncbi:MAG TPA: acetate kinase [Candidatus Acidoferrales bacterium]|jgi:acetate kinase|nr:acetate kinase [Candidatus Acidoferrales bacterium]